MNLRQQNIHKNIPGIKLLVLQGFNRKIELRLKTLRAEIYNDFKTSAQSKAKTQ